MDGRRVPVKVKTLSKHGINRLEKVMLANKKLYNQGVYGENQECGTVMCAAGVAHFMEVGDEQFKKEVKRYEQTLLPGFPRRCERAGKSLLGIPPNVIAPDIFQDPFDWPSDLYHGFNRCRGPISRVRFYINMLRTRARANGSLRYLGEEE